MERINPFEFFALGETLQQLKNWKFEMPPDEVFWPLWRSHGVVDSLVKGEPAELTVSKMCAVRLRDAIMEILNKKFTQPGADGKLGWKVPSPNDEKILSWEVHSITTALTEFETVFREEMREMAAYRVPQRGIFDTARLVDSADQSFPVELAMVIPEKTKEDWRAAGRCLAFSLLSASGFHVARAVEGTIEGYYQQACGVAPPKKTTLNSWNEYLKALKAAQTAATPKTDLVPSDKVIAEIEQMKDDYRNPIAHPRIVLSEPDARMLFDNGESLIIAMAQEMKDALPAPSALVGLSAASALLANPFGAP